MTKRTILQYRYNHDIAINYTISPESAPTPGTSIPPDFYWLDYFMDKSLIVSHLQSVIDNYNSVLLSYMKTPNANGAEQLEKWSTEDQYNVTPTLNNFNLVAMQLVALINSRLRVTFVETT